MKRNRWLYLALTVVVMILGLGSRKYGNYLPDFLREYSGDALWALMVYLGFCFLFRRNSIKKIGLMSLAFSYVIEFSQIYQGQWINEIRATTLGALVLGKGFLISDLICYTVGIIIGVMIDFCINKT